MKRILKNISTVSFTTNSYGKIYAVTPKGTLTIEDSQADKISEELLQRFAFLRDITPKVIPSVEVKTVIEPNQKGKMRPVVKKIVKKGKGIKKL